jgi:phospholipase C
MIRFSITIPALLLALVMPMAASAAKKAPAGTAAMPACPASDPVVWVNTATHVYHAKGDKYFGNTKAGTYACTSKAAAMGARASGARKATAVATDAPNDIATPKGTKKRHRAGATPAP